MVSKNIFQDYYGNKVQFSFNDHPFSEQPKHVFVICRYEGNWLLTDHVGRGLEFPGGKVEVGETAREAAIREVDEETGGIVRSLHYIGQYKVKGKADTIIKNVYYAQIQEIKKKKHYFETNGPVLLKELPTHIKSDHHYSFIMKDEVLTQSLNYIKKTHSSSDEE